MKIFEFLMINFRILIGILLISTRFFFWNFNLTFRILIYEIEFKFYEIHTCCNYMYVFYLFELPCVIRKFSFEILNNSIKIRKITFIECFSFEFRKFSSESRFF